MVGIPAWMRRRLRARRSRAREFEYGEEPLSRESLRAVRKGLRAIRFGRMRSPHEIADGFGQSP
jgi:hypothetical protein